MLSVNSLAKAGVEWPSILARLEQKSDKVRAYGEHLVAFVRKFGGATQEFLLKLILSFGVQRNLDSEISPFCEIRQNASQSPGARPRTQGSASSELGGSHSDHFFGRNCAILLTLILSPFFPEYSR